MNSIAATPERPIATTKARFPTWLAISAVFFIVLGAKLAVILNYAVPMPHSDEWDAGAAWLYSRSVTGVLQFPDLFVPHNEHRIFTSRVLASWSSRSPASGTLAFK